MQKHRIYVPEVGGLGNQLFCLAYSLLLNQHGFDSRLLPQMTDRDMRSHRLQFKLSTRIQKLDTSVVVKSKITIVALNLLISSYSFFSGKLRLPLRKIENRRDISNIEMPAPSVAVVRGYFQNPQVFCDLTPKNRNLMAKALDLDLAEDQKESRKDKIVIHYRRGDYENNSETIGLLSNNYYLKAAAVGKKILDSDEVVIFSDGDASSLSQQLQAAGFTVSIFNDSGIDVAGLFKELACGAGVLIASNSSFSWWAGALGSYQKVVYPAKWFRRVNTVSMGLDCWISLEPTWEQADA